jgi:hypothetical protein
MENLETVIEDSLSDAMDTPVEPLDASTDVPEVTPDPTPAEPEKVAPTATGAVPEAPVETRQPDDFEKKFGISAQTSFGKENRIPYSRVKKITEKAVADARKEWETAPQPKLKEYENKLKEYDGRWSQVQAFEQRMVNSPREHLQLLATMPAWKPFFEALEQTFSGQNPQAQAQVQVNPDDDMPQPDQKMADGSAVYSMDGLKALQAWNRAQARKETLAEVERRYEPIEREWQTQQRIQSVLPQVRAQIEDARTWPLFKDNETEIVQALQSDRRLSLEGAYRRIVLPKIQTSHESEKAKLTADRNKVREELLAELKQAPRSSSVPTGQTKQAPVSAGPRSLEDVIAEQIKTLK